MTQQDVSVRISDDLRIAPELFGFHLYSRLEHVFVRKEDFTDLLAALGQWLEASNEDHVALVEQLAENIGRVTRVDDGAGFDE